MSSQEHKFQGNDQALHEAGRALRDAVSAPHKDFHDLKSKLATANRQLDRAQKAAPRKALQAAKRMAKRKEKWLADIRAGPECPARQQQRAQRQQEKQQRAQKRKEADDAFRALSPAAQAALIADNEQIVSARMEAIRKWCIKTNSEHPGPVRPAHPDCPFAGYSIHQCSGPTTSFYPIYKPQYRTRKYPTPDSPAFSFC